MGLNLSDLKNQNELLIKATDAAINAEMSDYNNYLIKSENDLLSAIETAGSEDEITKLIDAFNQNKQNLMETLDYNENREQAKVLDETWELALNQAINVRKLKIPLEKHADSLRLTANTALYTNDYLDPKNAVVINGITYQGGPGRDQIIYDAVLQAQVSAGMIKLDDKVKLTAIFAQEKAYNNFKMALPVNLSEAEVILNSGKIPVNKLAKATQEFREMRDAVDKVLKDEQNKNLSLIHI